jgi:hypothetical protein
MSFIESADVKLTILRNGPTWMEDGPTLLPECELAENGEKISSHLANI